MMLCVEVSAQFISLGMGIWKCRLNDQFAKYAKQIRVTYLNISIE